MSGGNLYQAFPSVVLNNIPEHDLIKITIKRSAPHGSRAAPPGRVVATWVCLLGEYRGQLCRSCAIRIVAESSLHGLAREASQVRALG